MEIIQGDARRQWIIGPIRIGYDTRGCSRVEGDAIGLGGGVGQSREPDRYLGRTPRSEVAELCGEVGPIDLAVVVIIVGGWGGIVSEATITEVSSVIGVGEGEQGDPTGPSIGNGDGEADGFAYADRASGVEAVAEGVTRGDVKAEVDGGVVLAVREGE